MGDVMFGELLENFRCGLKTKLEKENIDPFEHVSSILKKADLNVINLESVFSESSIRKKPFSKILISPEKYVKYLVINNISVVNTANNHSLDHGKDAFERSIGILKANKIRVIGYDKNKYFQDEPVVVNFHGEKIGFLGYNIANFPDNEIRENIDNIKDVIGNIRPSLDLIIISMHWGKEYTNIPPSNIVGFGKELLKAGCDILYGHHSHYVQGVIKDNNKIFAPSLGNFIFDQKRKASRITSILQTEINNDGLSYEYSAYYMNGLFQPVKASIYENYMNKINTYLRDCYESGNQNKYEKIIEKKVKIGHRNNRIFMRIKMLMHFWDYLPYTKRILSFKFSKETIFSAISDEKSLKSRSK
jgi:poly-gamma-glutamate capsule biosynthesis protein CapA/YwtB (metallophosphatase superfamily)